MIWYASIRKHTKAYESIRKHTLICIQAMCVNWLKVGERYLDETFLTFQFKYIFILYLDR